MTTVTNREYELGRLRDAWRVLSVPEFALLLALMFVVDHAQFKRALSVAVIR